MRSDQAGDRSDRYGDRSDRCGDRAWDRSDRARDGSNRARIGQMELGIGLTPGAPSWPVYLILFFVLHHFVLVFWSFSHLFL